MIDEQHIVEHRITELNNKASQLLMALSFAIAAAILLTRSALTPCEHAALRWSLRFWVLSVFPALLIILPAKEFRADDITWYRRVRTAKVVFLWTAVVLIGFGAVAFLCAVWSLA